MWRVTLINAVLLGVVAFGLSFPKQVVMKIQGVCRIFLWELDASTYEYKQRRLVDWSTICSAEKI